MMPHTVPKRPMNGAESVQKLIALAADAAKHTPFLEDHGPRNEGKEKKKRKNPARDHPGLLKNVSNIGR